MLQTKKNTILKLIFLFSVFSLFIAYFIEHILDHQPCNLCLFERIPYYLAIIIIALNFALDKYQKIFYILLGITFVCASILSFYHFGIEQGFFKESFVCKLSSANNSLNAEDILKELSNSNVSCKNVTFRILGFSLATINTIISIFLSIIIIKIFISNEKNK